MSPFHEKIFECLTMEITLNNKKILISNIYRSPNPPPNVTNSEQFDQFIDIFSRHLTNLSTLNDTCYLFLDSNINLLDTNAYSTSFVETALASGFLVTNHRVTRSTPNSNSAIDQILTNSKNDNFSSGTLLSDISDHFFIFIQPNFILNTKPPSPPSNRNMSTHNMTEFKNNLRNLSWQSTYNSNDVNLAYNNFWSPFKTLFELHFPFRTPRPNRNFNKINDFMTPGLLISRRTKNELFKKKR